MKYQTDADKRPGVMTIRCWNCGKKLETHPCSRESHGAVLHELCKPCKDFLEPAMKERR